MSYKDQQQPILFFDGVCNLCSGAVQFIMRHDKKQKFLFASLQSPQGAEAMRETRMDATQQPGSIILYYNGKYYLQSAAILQTTKLLGGAWAAFSILGIVPAFLRNAVYRLIARNRYKWFGKRDECMLPTPENKARFLQ